jgi:hypothetical protein
VSEVNLTNPTNRQDPLLQTGQQAGRALFDIYSRASNGFSRDDVINAAMNVLVNAIRQEAASRSQAEARYDELAAKTKGLLMGHYDSVSGKRRSVFPFTQHVHAELVHFDDRFNK